MLEHMCRPIFMSLIGHFQKVQVRLEEAQLGSISDMSSNMHKLETFAKKPQNEGTDLDTWATTYRSKSTYGEQPYCWMVWLKRGCEFLSCLSIAFMQRTVICNPSEIVSKAYEESLKQHHNWLTSISAKLLLKANITALSNKSIEWTIINRECVEMMKILNKYL
jgi:hypothetical protein